MARPISAIEPHTERAVVGALVLRRALHERADHVETDRSSAALLRSLEEWVSGQCETELTLVDETTSAAEFLPGLAESFAVAVSSAAERHSDDVRQAFSELVEHVRRRVSEFSEGADPLRTLESWALDATEAWYQAVVSGITERLAAAAPSYGHELSPCPEDAAAPWCLVGRTRFPSVGPASEFGLVFGSRPDWDTWSAIPYVLLHELVSHVTQGPWNEMCRQPSDADPFAEGWMDVVAHMIHNVSVVGGGPPAVSSLPDWPDHCAAADGLHADRHSRRRYGLRRRIHGMDVARRLAVYLRFVSGSDEGDERFLLLSMRLNVSAASASTREWFVWGVEEALLRTEENVPLHDGETLDGWLARYEENGDVDALVDRLVTLARTEAAAETRAERPG